LFTDAKTVDHCLLQLVSPRYEHLLDLAYPPTMISPCRYCFHLVWVQFNRHRRCPVAALPVLRVVFPHPALDLLEQRLPENCLVSLNRVISFRSVLLLLAIEVAWNVYPSTNWSSGLLLGCHAAVVAAILSSTAKALKATKIQ
jgi:hypothetical protein